MGAPGVPPAGNTERSFGVRQLAAAFLPASLLAQISTARTIRRQQAGSRQSGSKLPHSKASLRSPTLLSEIQAKQAAGKRSTAPAS